MEWPPTQADSTEILFHNNHARTPKHRKAIESSAGFILGCIPNQQQGVVFALRVFVWLNLPLWNGESDGFANYVASVL